MMPGLLDNRYRGLLGSPSPRQVRVPGQPGMGGGMPFMGMGGMMGQGGGAVDPRDAPGTGLSIWREMMRGLSQHGIAALSPDMAGTIFSGPNRALLGSAYQKQPKGKR